MTQTSRTTAQEETDIAGDPGHRAIIELCETGLALLKSDSDNLSAFSSHVLNSQAPLSKLIADFLHRP